jgi:hypothetical protein
MKTKRIVVDLNGLDNGNESVLAVVNLEKQEGCLAYVLDLTIETNCHGLHTTSLSVNMGNRKLPSILRDLASKMEVQLALLDRPED